MAWTNLRRRRSGPSERQRSAAATLAEAAGYAQVDDALQVHNKDGSAKGYSELIDLLKVESQGRPMPERPATEKQRGFIQRMMAEKGLDQADIAAAGYAGDAEGMTLQQASQAINWLKRQPPRRAVVRIAGRVDMPEPVNRVQSSSTAGQYPQSTPNRGTATRREIELTERGQRATSLVPAGDIEVPAPPGMVYDRDAQPGTSPQLAAVENILAQPGTIVGGDMGIGKTVMALGAINADPAAERVLVITPASTKGNWAKHARDWLVEQRPIYEVNRGEPYPVPPTGPVFVITNYETFSEAGKHDVRESIKGEEWDVAIIDESHKLKNLNAKRTQAIFGTYGRFTPDFSGSIGTTDEGNEPQGPIRAHRRIAMTGTLQDKDASELYGPLAWTAPEEWTPTAQAYGRFIDRYMGYVEDSRGNARRSGTNPETADELRNRMLNTSLLRYSKDELLPDLPTLDRRVVMMEAPEKGGQRTGMRSYEGEVQFRPVQNVASMQGALTGRELMEHLGIRREEISKERLATGLSKAPAVAAYAAEAAKDGDDVLLFAFHKEVANRLAQEMEEQDIPHFLVTGDTPEAARQDMVDKFQAGEGKVFVASLGTMAVGLTLTRANRAIFAEPDWSASNVSQAEARIHRMGQTRPVLVEYIMLADSIDGMLAGKIAEKAEGAMSTVGVSKSAQVHKAYDGEGREITSVESEGVSARRGSKRERRGEMTPEARLFLGWTMDLDPDTGTERWTPPDIPDEEYKERQAAYRKEQAAKTRAAKKEAAKADPLTVDSVDLVEAWETHRGPPSPPPPDTSPWETREEEQRLESPEPDTQAGPGAARTDPAATEATPQQSPEDYLAALKAAEQARLEADKQFPDRLRTLADLELTDIDRMSLEREYVIWSGLGGSDRETLYGPLEISTSSPVTYALPGVAGWDLLENTQERLDVMMRNAQRVEAEGDIGNAARLYTQALEFAVQHKLEWDDANRQSYATIADVLDEAKTAYEDGDEAKAMRLFQGALRYSKKRLNAEADLAIHSNDPGIPSIAPDDDVADDVADDVEGYWDDGIDEQDYLEALAAYSEEYFAAEADQDSSEGSAEIGPGPEGGEREPSPAQRVRERIGDAAPTEELLVSVYVNADAEERAYLDSLGVGDLAERRGHRVETADAALVENALDDGWVTDEEASAAGRVQNLAGQETPDPLVPSYSMTQEEFEERVRELCDDPDAFARFEEQVEAQAVAAKAERKYRAKQRQADPVSAAAQDVSGSLRSDAGEALRQRASQAAQDRDGLLEGLEGEERNQMRAELEQEGVLTPRKRTWTAKQLRKMAREFCPPTSAIRQTRGARNSTLPKPPKPPSTAAPKSGRSSSKSPFTAGMRR